MVNMSYQNNQHSAFILDMFLIHLQFAVKFSS